MSEMRAQQCQTKHCQWHPRDGGLRPIRLHLTGRGYLGGALSEPAVSAVGLLPSLAGRAWPPPPRSSRCGGMHCGSDPGRRWPPSPPTKGAKAGPPGAGSRARLTPDCTVTIACRLGGPPGPGGLTVTVISASPPPRAVAARPRRGRRAARPSSELPVARHHRRPAGGLETCSAVIDQNEPHMAHGRPPH